MMSVGKKVKHEPNDQSDFNDFLNVLDDLERNADHVAIGNLQVVFLLKTQLNLSYF